MESNDIIVEHRYRNVMLDGRHPWMGSSEPCLKEIEHELTAVHNVCLVPVEIHTPGM
jgi:hypothetical protein